MLALQRGGVAGVKSPIGRRAQLDVKAASSPAQPSSEPSTAPVKPVINVIPNNGVWPNGIPPVMGAHLMASGTVAPVSTSKGAGIDVHPPEIQYFDREGNVQVVLHATVAAARNTLAKCVGEAADQALKQKGSFTIVLSGGSLFSQLTSLINLKTSWDKWHVFFVDERNVPHDSPDSNYKGAYDAFLSKVPIPDSQVYKIAQNVPVREAAVNYEGQLIALSPDVLPRNADGFPVFDIMLLGLGPDGHIASLFPHRAELSATTGWVLPVANSPKPPPERITFTLPVINSAKDILMVALSESKAEVVQRALEVQALPGALPAQLVRPKDGKVKWLLDVHSAQHLDIANWDDTKAFPRSQ